MKIFEDGGNLFFANYSNIMDELQPGSYVVKKSMAGFFLSRTVGFKIPKKVYGDITVDRDFYVKAFNESNKNLGIVFNGEKGSGKTLLTAMICEALNLPVIRIEDKYMGSGFINFINGIQQPCVVLIDEFDKLYSKWEEDYDDGETRLKASGQTELLKLMDGGTASKKLFLLTSNENALSEYMTNRPSRIKYKQSFGKMEDDAIREVLEDKLNNKEYIEEFIELSSIHFGFNLDTLLLLIDETNRLNASPKVAIKKMNIQPEGSNLFTVELTLNETVYKHGNEVSFDIMDKQYLPTMHFFEGEDRNMEDELNGAKRKQPKTIKYIQAERRTNFIVKASKEGFLFTHRKDGYTLMFKKVAEPKYASYVF